MVNHLFNVPPQINAHITKETQAKVSVSLLNHVYSQINMALLSSLFCGAIIVIGLYNSAGNNKNLTLLACIFIGITIFRFALSKVYSLQNPQKLNVKLWRAYYILGTLMGGAIWGMAGVVLLPDASASQQTLLILMLAGVTAGSVPLSAAIPIAGMSFLVASILPFIVAILLFRNETYFLFDIALTLYLGYTFILTFKTYKLIKNSIILKYENDILLKNLEVTNRKLEKAATLDPLTQVSNRRLFEVNFASAIQRAKNKNSFLSLFYIDLDHFKEANDKFGHYTGDYVLKTVIDRMRVFFRKDDIIARLGGDELVVIIERVHDLEELQKIAIKICQIISLPIEMKDATIKISASVGVSMFPNDAQTAEGMIKSADRAMYYAKEHGGNNYQFASQLPETVTD